MNMQRHLRAARIAGELGLPMPPAITEGAQAQQGDKPKRQGRNGPCPCGSGLKYKKCCLVKERAREAAERAERRRPRRQRTPPRPKSAVAVQEFIPVTEPQFDDDAAVAAMKHAGIKPEVIYAFQKTGRFITPEAREMYDEQTLAEWDAAIEEYTPDGEEDQLPSEDPPPASAGADARE